jgi:hypothetical protein
VVSSLHMPERWPRRGLVSKSKEHHWTPITSVLTTAACHLAYQDNDCSVLVVAIIWTGRHLDRSINKQPGVKQKSQMKLYMDIRHDAMYLRVPGRLCCKLSREPLMARLSVYSNTLPLALWCGCCSCKAPKRFIATKFKLYMFFGYCCCCFDCEPVHSHTAARLSMSGPPPQGTPRPGKTNNRLIDNHEDTFVSQSAVRGVSM